MTGWKIPRIWVDVSRLFSKLVDKLFGFVKACFVEVNSKLVGGFNPSEKYYIVKLDHFPKVRGEILKMF